MFCPKCGNEIQEGMKFCMSCGAKVDVAAVVSEKVEEVKNQTIEKVNEVKEEAVEKVNEVKGQVKEKVSEVKEQIVDNYNSIGNSKYTNSKLSMILNIFSIILLVVMIILIIGYFNLYNAYSYSEESKLLAISFMSLTFVTMFPLMILCRVVSKMIGK